MTDWQKVKGVGALVCDVVEHGSQAVQRVHLETARRPFVVLEQIPGVAAPARVVHAVHDLLALSVYIQVRLVTRVTRAVMDAGVAAAEANLQPASPDPVHGPHLDLDDATPITSEP